MQLFFLCVELLKVLEFLFDLGLVVFEVEVLVSGEGLFLLLFALVFIGGVRGIV